MVAITSKGVTGEKLLEYQQEMQQRYLEISAEWNIAPESPDGQQIGIWSEQLALLDEGVQYAYMSRDPATAVGQALDDIADYSGIERKDATFSTASVDLSGVSGVLVPVGKLVRNTETGTLWETDNDVVIPGSTTVTCTTAGQVPASIGALSEISTPVAGWQSVTNAAPATQGRNEESDNEFRLRRTQTVGLPGSNQLDNILSAVWDVDDVVQVKIYENPDDVTDANGLLDHSIAIFAQGGDQDEIFDAISTKKNPGCGMNRLAGFPNTINKTVTTGQGNQFLATFFRPEEVAVYVELDIETDQLSDSDKPLIAQAIVDYSLVGYTGGGGFTTRGFQIGETIYAGKLFTPVNDYVGGQGAAASLSVGTSPSPTGSSVAINFNELAVFDVANITVNYV